MEKNTINTFKMMKYENFVRNNHDTICLVDKTDNKTTATKKKLIKKVLKKLLTDVKSSGKIVKVVGSNRQRIKNWSLKIKQRNKGKTS